MYVKKKHIISSIFVFLLDHRPKNHDMLYCCYYNNWCPIKWFGNIFVTRLDKAAHNDKGLSLKESTLVDLITLLRLSLIPFSEPFSFVVMSYVLNDTWVQQKIIKLIKYNKSIINKVLMLNVLMYKDVSFYSCATFGSIII